MKRSKSQGTAPKADPWAGVRPGNDTNAKTLIALQAGERPIAQAG